MAIDRRTLIRGSCLTAASLSARPLWAAAGLFRRPGEIRRASSETAFVVVNMNGGNDGLNTVIPFGDPIYRSARERIALTQSQVLRIDAATGLHPSLSHLHGYLESGKLAIVQGVGYPRPDLSHFRSDDIWEKATLDPDRELTGWLGRALDQLYAQDADAFHAVGLSGDVPALRGASVTSPVVSDPGSFNYNRDDPNTTGALKAMLQPSGGSNRDYVSHIGAIALADVDAVQAALAGHSSTVVYPESSGLAQGLQLTASILVANVGPRVFFISQPGYDTHSNQLGDHEKLLLELDQSIDAFYRDLVENGQDRRVVVMTYSEFGRRVEDNGSGGTDHGTAAPLFVFGTPVRGGLYGTSPSLKNLDPDGNLEFSVDFRQVYSSILANWIDTDPVPVVGDYPTLSFL